MDICVGQYNGGEGSVCRDEREKSREVQMVQSMPGDSIGLYLAVGQCGTEGLGCFLYSIDDKDVDFYIKPAELLGSRTDMRKQESKAEKVV